MKNNLMLQILSIEASKASELLRAIELKGKSLEPFIDYYARMIIENDKVPKSVGSFHNKSLNTTYIFKQALEGLNQAEVTEESIRKIYSPIRRYLDEVYGPSLLLKATILMHRDLDFILRQLKKDKRALQDYVLKRQYYLFLAVLYLELFGARNTVHLLESLFEKDQAHPYVQTSDYDFSHNDFTLFCAKIYSLLKDYGGLSDSMYYHFRPMVYNDNVRALNGESLSVGDYHKSMIIENGHEIVPADYFLIKEGPFLNRDYFYECIDSIKYMLKHYIEKDSYYILSPVINALLTFEAKGQDNPLNHKRATFEVFENEENSKGDIRIANFFQLGDIYFAQRSYFGGGCRYCQYMYPLTHYATLHIKDLSQPTDEEIEILYNKTKHIFKLGGI